MTNPKPISSHVTAGVRSGTGLTTLSGLDSTYSITLRQDQTDTGTPAGWPRRNDAKAGSQERHQSRKDGYLERRDKGHVGGCLKKTEARTETSQEPREAEIKTGLEEANATKSEMNQEEVEAVTIRKSVRKRPRWKLSKYWRTEMGIGI
jgi:hypothetical protein